MKPIQKFMVAFSFGLGLLVLTMRFASPGWSTLLLGPLDLVAVLIHWALTLYVANRPYRKSVVVLIVTASVWLIIAVGFQVDFGDGGEPWFVFMSLFSDRLPETNAVPIWWPFREPAPFVFDIAVLASIIILWTFAFRLIPPKESIAGQQADARESRIASVL